MNENSFLVNANSFLVNENSFPVNENSVMQATKNYIQAIPRCLNVGITLHDTKTLQLSNNSADGTENFRYK